MFVRGASAEAIGRLRRLADSGTSARPLKVVYVVGVVDSVGGPGTQTYIDNARANAARMRAMGLDVLELYPPDNHWPTIRASALDASVLIYAGHGVAWGGDPPLVGGLLLQPGETVHPDRIRAELRMGAGAIVILNHICYSAGISAEDTGPISGEEARRRVAQYSVPFLDAGLAGYFANMYGNFPAELLAQLLRGRSLGGAYEAHWDYNATSVERYRHPERPGQAMWLDKDDWDGLRYNYAFAGREGQHLRSGTPLLQSVAGSRLLRAGTPGGTLAYGALQLATRPVSAPTAALWLKSVLPQADMLRNGSNK